MHLGYVSAPYKSVRMNIGIPPARQVPYLPARGDSVIAGCLNVPVKSDRQGAPTNLDEIPCVFWANLPSPTAGIGESATFLRPPVQVDKILTLPAIVQGILSPRLKYRGRKAARIARAFAMDATHPS